MFAHMVREWSKPQRNGAEILDFSADATIRVAPAAKQSGNGRLTRICYDMGRNSRERERTESILARMVR